MTTNSTGQGKVERILRQMRGQDSTPAAVGGYENAGIVQPTPGDGDAPWAKTPPFPTAPAVWLEHTFVSADYVFLDALDVGNVRTVTALFAVTGGESGNTALSILGGVVLGGAPELLGASNLADFYPVAVVDVTANAITLPAPFSTPAISRDVMPAELRTNVVANNTVVRFALQWDVSGYERFTLALADLGYSDDDGGTVLVHFAFAS